MNIFFWRREKGKTEEAVMEEIREIREIKKQKESDEWRKEYEIEKRRIKEDVEEVIKDLPTLSVRRLEATKKGKDSIRIMRLKRRHLSNSNYSFSKLSYHYLHINNYSEYIDNSDILNLISILERKGLEVSIEMEQYHYGKEVDVDDLKDSSWECFNPNAYLSVSW